MLVLNSTASGLIPSGLPNQAGIQVNRGADSAQNDAGPSAATVQDAFWVFDEQFQDDGTTIYGNTGGAWTAYRSANQLRDKHLIDIRANVVHATATSAQYADLAEKYETDSNYEVGTVVVFGGEKEVTQSTISNDTRVAGVVSENPAYLMNDKSEGQAIALVGKVKCKVHGMVSKGDLLTTCGTHPGCAQKAASPVLGSIVGKAMENKDDAGESVILISVGRL